MAKLEAHTPLRIARIRVRLHELLERAQPATAPAGIANTSAAGLLPSLRRPHRESELGSGTLGARPSGRMWAAVNVDPLPFSCVPAAEAAGVSQHANAMVRSGAWLSELLQPTCSALHLARIQATPATYVGGTEPPIVVADASRPHSRALPTHLRPQAASSGSAEARLGRHHSKMTSVAQPKGGAVGASDPPVLPPFATRLELARLLQQRNATDGVELGVRRGMFSVGVLATWHAARYALVDAWTQLADLDRNVTYTAQYRGERFDPNFRATLAQRITRGGCTETFAQAARADDAKGAGARCGTRIEVCRNWTHVCVERFADASFDFIYVDALHDYKGALRDITLWWPKLRVGGIMAGHDFNDDTYFYYGSTSTAGALDGTPGHVSRVDARKFYGWRRNYDGTMEPTGRLVKGAVEDFFGCKAEVNLGGVQVVPAAGAACDHRRPVSATTSRREYPPSWAVLK